MPYSTPAFAPAPLPIHSTGRPGHRRAYTAPSSGPGAFASLGVLPRRRTKKTVFHLSNDDDDDDDNNSADDSHDHDDDDALHNVPPTLKLKPNNSFRLAIYTEDDAPVPMRTTTTTTSRASVPFPTSSPHHSPPMVSLPTPPAENTAPRPNMSRTTSTPILLSNGKPLKSSLKSSSSSPHITLPSPTTATTTATQPAPLHLRARSAPSTPQVEHSIHPVHKNVHFPSNEEGGLATVRIFNRSGKPASLSRPNNGDDTETETEGELSTGSGSTGYIRGGSAVFPFPRSPLSQDKGLGAAPSPAAAAVRYEVDPTQSSPIPATHPPSYANVHLESLSYNVAEGPNGKVPPGLSGTLLVRNIAYEKQVAVRFTLDDWQTTSEVSAKHLSSLPALPSSFLTHQRLTFGDVIALPSAPLLTATASSDESPQWDRFTFHIKLEDYVFKLAQRTLYLVVRYTAGCVGNGAVESWDNNAGNNYKIAFREATSAKAIPQLNPRGRVFAVSSPPSFAPVMTPPTTTQPHHAQMIAQTTLLRLRKLNLRNYAAPSLTVPGRVTTTTAMTRTPSPPSSSSSSMSAPAPAAVASSAIGGGGPSSEAQGGSDGNSVGTGMEILGGFPAHVVGPTTKTTTTSEGGALDNNEGSESGSESEDEELKTPTGRSRTPSPPTEDPAGGHPHHHPGFFGSGKHRGSPPPMMTIPLLTFSSSSASSSASSSPPSGTSSPQIPIPTSSTSSSTITSGGLDVNRPSVLSPLEMGTSPPFSMMADLGPNFTKRKDYHHHHHPTPTEKQKTTGDAPLYWPWGMMMNAAQPPTTSDGADPTRTGPLVASGQKSKDEVRKVLAGIREKSTSSPVRRVSPSGLSLKGATAKEQQTTTPPGSGRSSPVKESEKPSSVVVSPQPRMPNWSKVGSGWNRGSNSPSSPSPATPTAAAVSGGGGGMASHPRASPVHLNMTTTARTNSPLKPSSTLSTTTTTPPNTSPAPGPAPPPATTNHQDSVYQAFVRQWCFAQGPSTVPGHSPVITPPVVHSTAPARYGGRSGGGGAPPAGGGREGGGAAAAGGGQLVV